MTKFAGLVICITGAANGIGKSLLLEFAKRGARVVGIDRDSAAIDHLRAECRKTGLDPEFFVCDLTQRIELHRVIDEIQLKFKNIDYWINNAGIAINHRLNKISMEDFEKCIAINLTAVVAATRYVLPHMLQRGRGSIVNMASVAGHVAPPYMSAYAATKHAVVGFTRSLRAELEFDDSPIRAVLVSPGFVETNLIQKGADLGFPEWMSWMLDTAPKVAKRIVDGLSRDELEILPTKNGKAMLAAHRLFPKLTVKGSRVLLTGSLKDLLLNRYKLP